MDHLADPVDRRVGHLDRPVAALMCDPSPFVHDGTGPDVDPVTGDEAETEQPFTPNQGETWTPTPH